ncbi:MAG TPA: YhjD/YihY/BrkB family envelope integrity protein, partial [Polyangiaceae bacterium]|nr:YhjD/YihY/BrkB family envelope integrity protein [Polyangiaceae bacterium]
PVAAVVFVWLASGGVQAVFDLLEVQTGVSRPWWKKRVIAIGACLGLSAGTALMGVISAGLDGIVSFLRGAIPRAGFGSEQSFVDAFVRAGMTLVTGVALVAGVFYIGVPGPARNGMPILPGALVAVLLQWLLGRGYVFYLAQVGTGSAYQASLSIIAVTLMALYLFALALLIGAEVNASVAKAKKASQPSSRIPPNAR